MKAQLDTEVLSMLNARRGEWRDIAAKSDVSYSWLSKFANGHISNPGYATLRGLHQFLSSSKPKRQRQAA